jgi:hypothetical protein
MQHVANMRRIILLSAASPNISIFSTLSLKRHNFPENAIENQLCFIFSTNFVGNISRSKNNTVRYYRKSA